MALIRSPLEAEDEQAGPLAVVGRAAKVEPERWLTIRSRRHEVMPPARAEEAGVEAGYGDARWYSGGLAALG